jgi:SAM-dependent methyltransferase
MATTGATGRVPSYLWDNAWAQARQRLQLLEATYDSVTIRHLEALGVGPGWRCLEVGAGAGSIARWLCQRVGADGRVVATDIDTRFLQEIDAENLDVLRHDLVADPLPEGLFDLVHIRAVLMHLPQREALLSTLAGGLAPGGWLLIEDGDLFPVTASADGAYAAAWDAVNEALVTTTGFAPFWARSLPRLLVEGGLCDVGGSADVPLFPGGSAAAELFALTWDQALERVTLDAEGRVAVERARQELADPDRWFLAVALVAAWGRRPRNG